jgi:hypothetical protein
MRRGGRRNSRWVSGIFISYRREDTAGHAGRLAQQLGARFGARNVFIDIDAIPAGVDFEERIHQTLADSHVTLVLIGEQWLSQAGESGGRRIEQADDYVRLEIAAALARADNAVIPVLIEGAAMPSPDQSPPDIAPLTKRNAFKLANERWNYDFEQLCRRIEEIIIPNPILRRWRRGRRNARWVLAGAALAAVAVVAAVIASSSGGASAAVRVDDIPISNPPAQYRSGKLSTTIQVETSKPWIELKIHNVGKQTSDITRARLTVTNARGIRPCFSAGGGPLSAVYDFTITPTPGFSRDEVINEQVKPDAMDHFRIVLDLPISAYGPGNLDHWFVRLRVQLLHDAQTRPVDGGYVLLSFSGAADPKDYASWWTTASAASPGYATLTKTWGAASINCAIRQTPEVRQFLALPGRRAPELADFASQLTTRP